MVVLDVKPCLLLSPDQNLAIADTLYTLVMVDNAIKCSLHDYLFLNALFVVVDGIDSALEPKTAPTSVALLGADLCMLGRTVIYALIVVIACADIYPLHTTIAPP